MKRHDEARGRSAWARLTVLAGLLAMTGWTVTRSSALEEAESVERRASSPEGIATALSLALDHLGRRPWSRPAALIAARCLSRLDHPDLAEPYYLRAGTLSRNDLHLRAYAILRSNQRDRAIDAYHALLERWPEDVEALRLLAGIAYSRKQYDDALELAARLKRIDAGAANGYRLAATIQHELMFREEAVEEVRGLLSVDPALRAIPAEARSVVAMQYVEDLLLLGQAEEARRFLEDVVPDEGNPWLRTLLGRAYLLLGDPDRAERCWREVVTSEPRADFAWAELGRLALSRKRPVEAIEALRRAEELNPRDQDVLFSLMTAYAQDGRRDEARDARDRLERLRAATPPPSHGMGAQGHSRP